MDGNVHLSSEIEWQESKLERNLNMKALSRVHRGSLAVGLALPEQVVFQLISAAALGCSSVRVYANYMDVLYLTRHHGQSI